MFPRKIKWFSVILCLIMLGDLGKTNIIVNGPFQKCDVDQNLDHLALDESCFSSKNSNAAFEYYEISNNETYWKNVTVLTKNNNILDTLGFECKSKTTVYSKENSEVVTFNILTKEQCELLVRYQICFKKTMKCKNNLTCHAAITEYPGFPFNKLGKQKTIHECQFTQIKVISSNLSEPVFKNAISSCKPLDGKCEMSESVIIWDENLASNCPYQRLFTIDHLVQKAGQYKGDFKGDYSGSALYSKKDFLLFILTSKVVSECGLILYLTSEGLYLSLASDFQTMQNIGKLSHSKYNIKDFQDYYYGDHNFNENDFQSMHLKEELRNMACMIMLNTIRLHLNNQDKFVNVNYMGKKFTKKFT